MAKAVKRTAARGMIASAPEGLKYLILLAGLFTASCAGVTGAPQIVNGDTIIVDGERIRLFGIDAPDPEQTCAIDGKPYRCGAEATKALMQMVSTADISCRDRGRSADGHIIGVCSVGATDLAARMVSAGWALADTRVSTFYVDEEKEAKAAHKGIWRGTFTEPWKWQGQ